MSESRRRSVLLGLIGRGIGASLSPLLHESEAAAHQLQLVYRLVDFAQLDLEATDIAKAMDGARLLGMDGFNVTHPYKNAIVPLLHELSPEAAELEAVNTVVLRDGRRIGHNTDWSGFATSMRVGLPGANLQRVAQLGAGGAGAATAYALLMLGAEQLRLFDVDTARAEQLANKLSKRFPDRSIGAHTSVAAALRDATGLVQTTPIGMNGHAGMPIPPQLLDGTMWVADIIYTPAETELLAQARALGCRTINGSGMVVFQAAGAFRLFTGLEPDVTRMRHAFDTASK